MMAFTTDPELKSLWTNYLKIFSIIRMLGKTWNNIFWISIRCFELISKVVCNSLSTITYTGTFYITQLWFLYFTILSLTYLFIFVMAFILILIYLFLFLLVLLISISDGSHLVFLTFIIFLLLEAISISLVWCFSSTLV